MTTTQNVPTLRPHVIRPGKPTVRTTFQFAADLGMLPNDTPDTAMKSCTTIALRWLAGKFPQQFPQEAWDGNSFEIDVHGQQIQAVAIKREGVWAIRLVQPDAPFMNRDAVPGRTWTTELSFRRSRGSIRFGARVLCGSLPYATEEIVLTRPRVVLDLAEQFEMTEVRPLLGQPWHIDSEQKLDELLALVTSPDRTLPVYLLTEADPRAAVEVRDYVLDAQHLARKTQALAHVVTMPLKTGFGWTDRVGKPWSVFHGAVRTYRPGLNLEEDTPATHPRAMLDRILYFRYSGLKGDVAFEKFLIDQAHEHAATKPTVWGNCVFFANARTMRAKLDAEEAQQIQVADSSNEEQINALKDKIEAVQKAHSAQIDALNAKVKELEEESEAFNDDAIKAGQDRDLYIEENHKLRTQIEGLRMQLEAKTGESIDAGIPIPDTYEGLDEWVEQHLVGRLMLHPRAVRNLKNACYEDVGLVYRSLQLLANVYRNMRLGQCSQEDYELAAGNLELRHSGSISKERAGEEGDTYFVKWPLHTNHKHFIDLHLRKGSAKDDRYCLGIYFFWDDETQQVIVGWLPSHLQTRAT